MPTILEAVIQDAIQSYPVMGAKSLAKYLADELTDAGCVLAEPTLVRRESAARRVGA
jgi:hypothetical protein